MDIWVFTSWLFMNNAAMNICVQLFTKEIVILEYVLVLIVLGSCPQICSLFFGALD